MILVSLVEAGPVQTVPIYA